MFLLLLKGKERISGGKRERGRGGIIVWGIGKGVHWIWLLGCGVVLMGEKVEREGDTENPKGGDPR